MLSVKRRQLELPPRLLIGVLWGMPQYMVEPFHTGERKNKTTSDLLTKKLNLTGDFRVSANNIPHIRKSFSLSPEKYLGIYAWLDHKGL